MAPDIITIRTATPEEFAEVGRLMHDAYALIKNFPKPDELPSYFQFLLNAGELTQSPGTEIIIALVDSRIAGAVVYIGNMKYYSTFGNASSQKDAAGFRLLAVNANYKGRGIGKQLSVACIEKAKAEGKKEVIIHTTKAMQNAWDMYERIGFKRSPDLDFTAENISVFGFRLPLT
jgi:GNAT superfamily N-acetyltransferase